MNFGRNKSLLIMSIVWGVAIGAALLAAMSQGYALNRLAPYAGGALIPALVGIVLYPFADRQWAQVIVILSWIGLAIAGCVAVGFVPMAVLFLCAPAAASLFDRERVIEAMVLSAVSAGLLFYADQFGLTPEPIASQLQGQWASLAAISATITFMLGAIFFAANIPSSEDNLYETPRPVDAPNPQDKNQDNDKDVITAFPRPLMQFSKQGTLLAASPAAMKMFDISETDFDTVDIAQVFSASDDLVKRLENASKDALEFGVPQSESLVVTYVDDQAHTREHNLIVDIVAQNDDKVDIFFTEIDSYLVETPATEVPANDANETMKEKNLFFAGVSHELRTPLNAIIGFSDMMRSRLFGPLPGKYSEYADLIHDSGQHMLDLLGDVLDLSKVEAGKYSLHYDVFDAADVVRSSVKMVRPSADAAEVFINVEIDEKEDLSIEADRKALRQVLLNLLSNAIKFSPKGAQINVRAHLKDGKLHLIVQDHGMGMSARELEMIGKPYAQADGAAMIDTRGSGLGLALVKRLTDLHKGVFTVQSKPDEGTTVDVIIPVKPDGKDAEN